MSSAWCDFACFRMEMRHAGVDSMCMVGVDWVEEEEEEEDRSVKCSTCLR